MPNSDDELEEDFNEIRRLLLESLLPPSRQSVTSTTLPNVGPPVGSQEIPGTLLSYNPYETEDYESDEEESDADENPSDEERERNARRIAALPGYWPRQSMAGVLEYVIENPGLTATAIANALQLQAASVSSHLYKLLKQARVIRLPNKGKRGGFGYYVLTNALIRHIEDGVKDEQEPTAPTRSAWQHLLDD